MYRTLRYSSQIKKADVHLNLIGVADGACIEISQANKKIYLIYRSSEDNNPKLIHVNNKICELNDIVDQSPCQLKSIVVKMIQQLTVKVSKLDWNIVSRKYELCANKFLDQINIVWPNAKLPLYYSDHDYITLHVCCRQINQVTVNTLVQFLELENIQSEENKKQETFVQIYQKQIKLIKQEKIQQIDRYLNEIVMSERNAKLLNVYKQNKSNNLTYLINSLDFVNCPSTVQFNNLVKKKENQKNSYQETKILVMIKSKEEVSDQNYECHSQDRLVLGLSQKIKISNNECYHPKIENISLDIFLNTSQHKIILSQIVDQNHFQAKQNQPKQFITRFSQAMLNGLEKDSFFYIFQKNSPFSIKNKLFSIDLQNKTNREIDKDHFKIYCLINQQKFWQPQKKIKILEKILKQKIQLRWFGFSGLQITIQLKQRYSQMSKWIQLINLRKKNMGKLNQIRRYKQVLHLFEAIYQKEIQKLIKFIEQKPQFSQQICLITSFGSNGKSLFHKLLESKGYKFWIIDFKQLNQPHLNFRNIDLYLEWIFANSPYNIIYIDNFDALCSKIEQVDLHRQAQKIISRLVLRKFIKYVKLFHKRCILTAKSQGGVDDELSNYCIVNLRNPSRQLRYKSLLILREYVQKQQLLRDNLKSYKKQQNKISIQKIVDSTQSLSFGSFSKCVLDCELPNKGIVQKKTFDFLKLAGLKNAKSTIRSIIEKPIKYAFLFKSAPIKLPRGILLYGATGNGKSAIGAALEDQFKMKYFSVKGSDILSKYIGGSEAAVRDIFERALSVSPSIIFFDEFESIVPKRSANNTGVNDRIVNQFLCYLDGVSSTSGVFVIAASSRPDMIDPAILRPGRLDAHIYLQYPDDYQRLQMIHLFKKSVKISLEESQIVKKTSSFSYSDMVGVFKQLRIKRSSEVLQKDKYTTEDFININEELFLNTIDNFKQSVSENEQKKQKKIYQAFKNGVGPDINKQKQIQQ